MSTTDQRYEALCKKHGVDPNALPDVSKVPEERRKYNLAAERLAVITKCYNAEDSDGNVLEVGSVPDYSKGNRQFKYEIWFEVVEDKSSVSGFGLSCFVCDSWYSFTGCGGRLCFKDKETAKRAFNDFKEYYEDLYLPS
jgi:hypothetical protein